jgi:hypothetical protein
VDGTFHDLSLAFPDRLPAASADRARGLQVGMIGRLPLFPLLKQRKLDSRCRMIDP